MGNKKPEDLTYEELLERVKTQQRTIGRWENFFESSTSHTQIVKLKNRVRELEEQLHKKK